MTKERKRRMLENIYDLIKGGEFENEAKRELRSFIRHKNIEWSGGENTIKLGKYFIIKLL